MDCILILNMMFYVKVGEENFFSDAKFEKLLSRPFKQETCFRGIFISTPSSSRVPTPHGSYHKISCVPKSSYKLDVGFNTSFFD